MAHVYILEVNTFDIRTWVWYTHYIRCKDIRCNEPLQENFLFSPQRFGSLSHLHAIIPFTRDHPHYTRPSPFTCNSLPSQRRSVQGHLAIVQHIIEAAKCNRGLQDAYRATKTLSTMTSVKGSYHARRDAQPCNQRCAPGSVAFLQVLCGRAMPKLPASASTVTSKSAALLCNCRIFSRT